MIDYDVESRNSIDCVRDGVVNLEAFSNRVEMSKAVEGVVRFLWDKKQLLVDRVPYVLVADHSGRLDCYIQHMTDSEYGKHTGDCYRKL